MKHFCLFCTLLFLLNISTAQTPELVKDINAIPTNSASISFAANLGNITIFSANDGIHGLELWRTDGTAEGTYMLQDINPNGDGLSSSTGYQKLNDQLYFNAINGSGLWRTDGTIAGTVKVSNGPGVIRMGTSFSTALGNIILFSGGTNNNTQELWKSDGTGAGTMQVKDIEVGTNGSSVNSLTTIGSSVYFSAYTAATGYEFWKTDGTEAGTVMVKEINPGTGHSTPGNFTELNGQCYFSASNDIAGQELWKTDGTTEGTVMVKDIRPGSSGSIQSGFWKLGTNILFVAEDGSTGNELWKTDGTEDGTVMVKDIIPGVGSSIFNLNMYPIVVGNLLYFRATAVSIGTEMWRSDGTEAGTFNLGDFNPGVLNGNYGGYAAAGSNFCFIVNISGTNTLFKSDGTVVGTVAQPSSVFPAGTATLWETSSNTLLCAYLAASNNQYGTDLFKMNLQPGGFMLVKDVNATSPDGTPQYLTRMGNHIYFSSVDAVNGTTLWKTDGSTQGTNVLVPAGIGMVPLLPRNFYVAGTTLYFNAQTAATGTELWKTDGTTAGTTMVKDLNPGAAGTNPSGFCQVNNSLFYSASLTGTGLELFKSDGTEAGTVMVKDIAPGATNSQPQWLTSYNGAVYFSANNSTSGIINEFELWKSDGTDVGTVRVKDINPGVQSGGSLPTDLIVFNNLLFFAATNGVHGRELWKSDGSEPGTVMVKDIRPGSAASSPANFFVHNGVLYFSANDGTNGIELWRTDGTAEGTTMVKNINAGSGSSNPANYFAFNNQLFFSASTGSQGTELWTTDGTDAGTVMVKDILAGSTGSNPINFVQAGAKFYFRARINLSAEEWIFQSDGTADGTLLLNNMMNGTQVRFPVELVALNDMIIFQATTPETGKELYKISFNSSPAVLNWTGNVSTAWDNPGNWEPAAIPGASTEVIIPSGRPRYPLIQLNSSVKKITCQPGASVSVGAGYQFTVLQ